MDCCDLLFLWRSKPFILLLWSRIYYPGFLQNLILFLWRCMVSECIVSHICLFCFLIKETCSIGSWVPFSHVFAQSCLSVFSKCDKKKKSVNLQLRAHITDSIDVCVCLNATLPSNKLLKIRRYFLFLLKKNRTLFKFKISKRNFQRNLCQP